MARQNLVSRNVRVYVPLWDEAKEFAELDDETISDVVRDLLDGYVKRKRRQAGQPHDPQPNTRAFR
jgi:hypothetical protein